MEELISDLENRGLCDPESILDHFVQEELISESRANKVLRLMEANNSSKRFDVMQLHQLMEMISHYGKVDEDVLLNEITGSNMKHHKSEVTAAFYNWKRSPLARMLTSLDHGQRYSAKHDTVSAFQVESCHHHSPRRAKSPRYRSPRRSSPKRQASTESTDAEQMGFVCHEGCCQTASDETLSDNDNSQYTNIHKGHYHDNVRKGHKGRLESPPAPEDSLKTTTKRSGMKKQQRSRQCEDTHCPQHNNASDDEY